MSEYIVRRVLAVIPVLLGISFLVFVIARLIGDPAILMLGVGAPPEALEAFREEHGLNDPILVQYGSFLRDAIRGDFGDSFRQNAPAMEVVLERIPATLELSAGALLFSLILGLPLGILAAVSWNSPTDHLVRVITFFGQAIPTFYLGLVLILVFGARLQILPTGGRGGWQHLVLPSITLGMFLLALVARFTRAALLEVLAQDYIRTARAKGLRESTILLRHALKNALIPLVTVIGLQVGALLGGAVITETVFAWPGIGRLAIQSILARDFPVVQAVVMMAAVSFVFVNLLVDILYAYLDPRIRYH